MPYDMCAKAAFFSSFWNPTMSNSNPSDVPRTRRYFFTNKKKEEIVNEAYSSPDYINATARKYEVYPSQILYWENSIIGSQSVYSDDVPATRKISTKRLCQLVIHLL